MDGIISNSLSRTILPGHKTFWEYLLKNGKKNDFSYTLNEFGWELGIYLLRKKDADIVMRFLGDVARTIEQRVLKSKVAMETTFLMLNLGETNIQKHHLNLN